MAYYATAGTKVFVGAVKASQSSDFAATDFWSQVWTEVTSHESLGNVGDSAQAITQSLIKQARDQVIKGTRSAGTMELVCVLDSTDTGQAALVAAERTAYDYAFKIELGDVAPVRTATATITVASPGVVSWTAHGLVEGDKVVFSTTGALPTGLTAGTTYYVKEVVDANSFKLSATLGGTVINTSSTQSGVHTITSIPEGSRRYFVGKVMTAPENYGGANDVQKITFSVAINSNIVKVAATA